MAIFDDRELLEEVDQRRIAFDRRERTIQERGVTFVAVVLVPCLVRLGTRLIGRDCASATHLFLDEVVLEPAPRVHMGPA